MNPEIVKALLREIEALRDALGEYDADETLRADMLEGETDVYGVLRRILKAFRTAQFDMHGASEAKKYAIERYDQRIAAAQKRMETAKAMMLMILEAGELKSQKLPEGTISVQDGRKSLSLADDFTAPQGLQIVEIKPDRKAILERLEQGERIEGADIVIGKKIVSIR